MALCKHLWIAILFRIFDFEINSRKQSIQIKNIQLKERRDIISNITSTLGKEVNNLYPFSFDGQF